VSRFYLLGTGERPEVSQLVGFVVTFILLVSSFFMNRAETAMAYGDRKTFLRGLLITLVLGILFLIGVVGVEWQIAPFGPGDGAAASLFFATWPSCSHVLSGVIFLAIVYRNGRRGLLGRAPWAVEAAAVYWQLRRCGVDFLLPRIRT
jgi:cytochrome c oxidase subunit 3